MSSVPKRILFCRPLNDDEDMLFDSVRAAAARVGARVSGIEDYFQPSMAFMDIIANHDLLICDVTSGNPNVMFEIGYAQALGKPVIYLTKTVRNIPFDISNQRYLIYGALADEESRVSALSELLKQALAEPENFLPQTGKIKKAQHVFVSYSHRDNEYLVRLLVHLRPLQRAELIDVWADTRIEPGDKWKEEIEKALAGASVAVLLVSADFLASDFIVNNELPEILRNAAARGTRILPVIIKPCRFTRDNHLKEFQAINDPRRSLISLNEAEREEIYDAVAEAIERILSRNDSSLRES